MGNLPKCETTGKVRFETKGEAIQKIHMTKDIYRRSTGQRCNRLRRKRREKRVYYCSLCGGWHLTSREYNPPKKNIKKDLEISE